MSSPPTSLLKAFDILEAFVDSPEFSASELHSRLHIPIASQYRLLKGLVDRGYLARDPLTRRYKLGLQILRVAAAALEQMDILEIGQKVLHALWQETKETIHLAVLDGVEIVYVQTLESPQALRFVSRTGARAPAYCVASGKVILAFSDAEKVQEVIKNGFNRFNEMTIRSAKGLREELNHIRAAGFAVSRGERRREVSGVSAPVFDHLGKVVAAVGISGPSERFTESELPVLEDAAGRAAGEISRLLGAVYAGESETNGNSETIRGKATSGKREERK